MHGAGIHDEQLADDEPAPKGRTLKVLRQRNKQVGTDWNEYETELDSNPEAISSGSDNEPMKDQVHMGHNNRDPIATRWAGDTVQFMKHLLWQKFGSTDVILPHKPESMVSYIVRMGLKHVRITEIRQGISEYVGNIPATEIARLYQ
jgi:hypothetical protein